MFQTRLRELREAAGYKSQQAFADAFGVAQSTIGNWEAGKREPNYETTMRLARFFGVSIDNLLGLESKKEPTPAPEDGQNINIIKIAGRDGSHIERRLTDEQIAAFRLIIDQLPDADNL